MVPYITLNDDNYDDEWDLCLWCQRERSNIGGLCDLCHEAKELKEAEHQQQQQDRRQFATLIDEYGDTGIVQ